MRLIRRTMQAFLSELKSTEEKHIEKAKLCMVVGNEACDLDSAVCAVSLAYYYQVLQNQIQCSLRQSCVKTREFVPVLNIPKEDFILKTEVDFAFSKYGISPQMLTFIDELSEEEIESSEVILVDHHVSPFIDRCIEVFDHRPIDPNVIFPENCKVHIDQVGSCATLIAEKMLKESEVNEYVRAVCGFTVLSLLRNAIILDTVNFHEEAKRAKPKDIEVCEALEKAIELAAERPIETRKIVFDELVEARSDVESLTPLQILRKDVKFLCHKESGTTVAICSFPISLAAFAQLPDAEIAAVEFASKYEVDVIVLLSINVIETDDSSYIERELGVIGPKAEDLKEAITEALLTSRSPHLNLEHLHDIHYQDGDFFKQMNLAATRKHITPIVQKVVDEWWAPEPDTNVEGEE